MYFSLSSDWSMGPFGADVISQVVCELALNLPDSVISITVLYLVTNSRRDLIVLDL